MRPPLVYYGILNKNQKTVVSALETQVFQHWDGLESSPPRSRPQTEESSVAIDGLSLLSCDSSGRPGWPDHVMEKFREDSHCRALLQKMKDDFMNEFKSRMPESVTPSRTVPRVTGSPDFSVDGGGEPLDVNRQVDLEKVDPPVAEKRPGELVLVLFFGMYC